MCNAKLSSSRSRLATERQAELYPSSPSISTELPSQATSPNAIAAAIAESEAKDRILQRIFFGGIAGIAILALTMAVFYILSSEAPAPAVSSTPPKKIPSLPEPPKPKPSPAPMNIPLAAEAPQQKPMPTPEEQAPKALENSQSGSISEIKPEPAIKKARKPHKEVVYFLQLGAFPSPGETLKLCKKIQSAGFECYFGSVTLPKGSYYRLRVGPYDREAEARQDLGKLAAKGFSGRLIPLNAAGVKPPIQLQP
ncbi:MAG: SPOR domain-containing protein [Burkholderiales bacterium]